METVTDQRLSPMRSATKSFTNAPDRTVPRRTGRSSGSTARWPPNGPTPRPTGPRPTVQHPPELAASLQSPPTPHRHRRKDTHRAPTCSQPAREEHLGRVNRFRLKRVPAGYGDTATPPGDRPARTAKVGPQPC